MTFDQVRSVLVFAAMALSCQACADVPPAEPPPTTAAHERSGLSNNWREIKEGVDGFPAGPMLEIALRRTHADKLEMFKWRS